MLQQVESIKSLLLLELDLRCIHHVTLSTRDLEDRADKQDHKFLYSQPFHVSVSYAVADYMVFVHPKLATLVLVVAKEMEYQDKSAVSRHVRIHVAGHGTDFIHPGERIWKMNEETGEREPSDERYPLIPRGWDVLGGTCARGIIQRSYEPWSGDNWTPREHITEVIRFVWDEHFNMQEGRLEKVQLTQYSPHYCWPESVVAYWEGFPYKKLRQVADRWFGEG